MSSFKSRCTSNLLDFHEKVISSCLPRNFFPNQISFVQENLLGVALSSFYGDFLRKNTCITKCNIAFDHLIYGCSLMSRYSFRKPLCLKITCTAG